MDSLLILPSHFLIKGTIARFKDTNAVIITEENQTLLWPIKKLPDDVKIGEVVKLILTTDNLETQNREQLAKFLLNQILKK